MIYTVTLNPALDYFMTLENVPIDEEVNRATSNTIKAAGKGLNVSKILSILEIKSKAIAILGGFTGEHIKEEMSKDSNIELISLEADGDNRINVKIHYSGKAICVNGIGPIATSLTKNNLYKELSKINKDDYVIISGSMMQGFDHFDFITMANIINEREGRLILDAEQINLDTLISCKPWLIKPNLYEFSILMNKADLKKEDLEEYLKLAHAKGLENILLSLGKDGALFSTSEKNYYLLQPNTILVNKVGAGDAMLAAFIGKLSSSCSIEEALKYAGASGNAVASTLEDITLQDIQDQLKNMQVINK